MQVHHGFDINGIGTHVINNRIRKTVKIQLAILTPNLSPAFRIGNDTTHRVFKFVQKVIAQPGLLFFVPEGGSFQLFYGFRMPDDVH